MWAWGTARVVNVQERSKKGHGGTTHGLVPTYLDPRGPADAIIYMRCEL
jgi:hypothetical protein